MSIRSRHRLLLVQLNTQAAINKKEHLQSQQSALEADAEGSTFKASIDHTEKNKAMSLSRKWMQLQIMTSNESSQSQQDKEHLLSVVLDFVQIHQIVYV